MILNNQLETYIIYILSSKQFLSLKSIGDFAPKKEKCILFSLSSSYIGINSTCCYYYSGNNIFGNEYSEELIAQSNKRSIKKKF